MLHTNKKKGVFVSWKKEKVNNSGWWGIFPQFTHHYPPRTHPPSVIAFCLFVYLFIYSLSKGIFSLKELPLFQN